jgi:hypothetical protein
MKLSMDFLSHDKIITRPVCRSLLTTQQCVMDSDTEWTGSDHAVDADDMCLDDDDVGAAVDDAFHSDDQRSAGPEGVPNYVMQAFLLSKAEHDGAAPAPVQKRARKVAFNTAAAPAQPQEPVHSVASPQAIACPQVSVMFPQLLAWAAVKYKKQEPDAKFLKRMKITEDVPCSLTRFLVVSTPKPTPDELAEADQDDDDYCELCNTHKTFDPRTAAAVCLTCGLSTTYLVPDTSYREGVSIHTPYLYKRINHCRDHLHRITGRESTQIEPEVITMISQELAKTHTEDELIEVTQADIRVILKRLGLSRLYNHTTRIWALTTGGKPLTMTQTQEQELLHLFNIIQEPWERLRPSMRKNFLSYSYLLHKLSLLLGYTEIASHFKLLKSREKVLYQDVQWKKICQALGFKFERSVY